MKLFYIKLLWIERKRVVAWMRRRDLFTKKRYGFFEACRAVLENPPSFDGYWDYEAERQKKS